MSKKQDFYYWRLVATGFNFAAFGFGGLVQRFIIFPLIQLLPVNKRKKALLCRKFIHYCFRYFTWQMKATGVLTYQITGLEKLEPGQLIIANHPTLIDVVFLISFIENANCIVRHGLFKNIFTHGPTRNAQYIPNIEGNQLVEDCVKSLKLGDSLIVFPEGTRTPPNRKPKFQRGAANIALAAGIMPTPVTFRASTSFLTKGEKWYHIPFERPHLDITVGDSADIIQIGNIPALKPGPKAARELTRILYKYYFPEK